MSDPQETAQLLSGSSFPAAVLNSCLSGMGACERKFLRTVNLTAYDGHWERAVMRYHQGSTDHPKVTSLSLSLEREHGDFVQQVVGLNLLQASHACAAFSK